MTFEEYQQAATRTSRANPRRERLLVQSLGLNVEAGEVGEIINKWAWHGKPLDREAMAKELGDVLWYVTDLADAFQLTLEEIAEKNIQKLLKRYPDGFTPDGGKR